MKTKIFKTLTLALCTVAFSIATNAQFPNFISIDTGAIHASSGHHISSGWFDMDNDGDMDVVITNTSGKGYQNHPNLMYKNEQNGYFKQIENTAYTNQILNVGLPGPFGDIDNDGDQDLMNPNWMGTQFTLYNNDGYGNFENQNTLAQLYGATNVFFDLNNDSFLDILHFHNEMSRAYYNDGLGEFSDFVNLNMPCSDPNAILHNIAMGDADNDGNFDAYISYSTLEGGLGAAKNECFLNKGAGVFEKINDDNLIVQDIAMCPNANWVDYDNDGDMDLYVLNTFNAVSPSQSVSGALFENMGEMEFIKHIIEPSEYRDANRISSVWGDLDNDADLDLYITIEKNNFNAHVSPIKHNLLMQNNGDGTFSEITVGTLAEESSHTATIEDVDNDGDLDVLLVRFSWANNGNNTLCMNEGNDNSWLIMTCEGTLSNSTAFGTRVIAKANVNGKAVSQIREITPMSGHCTYPSTRVHFGLGDANVIDTLIIHWPSGHIDEYLNVKANQFYRAIEDSEFGIDFKATNYIQYSPAFADVEFTKEGESKIIDLNEYYLFIEGDTLPEIRGDALTFSIYNNENPEVVNATIDGSILTIEVGNENGDSKIQLKASAGFTKRVDHFSVKMLVNVETHSVKENLNTYPNPFTTSTTIAYELQQPSTVQIIIYNYLGKQLEVIQQKQSAGKQQVLWNAEGLPSGVYFCTLKTNAGMQTMKMIKL